MNNFHWEHHVIGPVTTNCYIFGTSDNAILMDPGGPEVKVLVEKAIKNAIDIKHILVTHGHFDHLGWASEVQKAVEGAKVYLHVDERPVYEEFHDWMSNFNLEKPELREPDVWVVDNQNISLGGYDIKVIHTPGHSPGSSTFIIDKFKKNNQEINAAFVGDCLFKGSIGRVDLPYCNSNDMEKSLRRLMQDLAEGTKIFPGHGDFSTIDHEMENNPFLKALQNNIPIF